MTTPKIAWRNLWRNPRRSVLTLLALAVSTALLLFMFAWQNGSYDSMIRTAVSTTTGELQILHAGYHEKRDMRKAIDHPGPVRAFLQGLSEVEAFAARAEAFVLAEAGDRSYGVLVRGVEVDREPEVSSIRTLVREGRYFSGDGPEILLGSRLAENLRAGLGDQIVLLGQGYDGSVAANVFTLQGIVESGQPELDRTLAQIPMERFAETFFMQDRVHRIVVNCHSIDQLESVAADLRGYLAESAPDLEVLTWAELVPGLKQAIQLDLISGYIFYFLLLVVVAFSIMNTFIMAVLERSREFGILNAIGTRRTRMARILIMETAFLGLCGIIAGLALGISLTAYAQHAGIAIPHSEELLSRFGLPDRIYPKLSWLVCWLAPLLVLGITLLSGVYPVFRLLRLNPVRAMHDS